jgi:hypothetical protein
MYSGRQRDLRERRAHQQWDAPQALDQDGTFEANEGHELEPSTAWSVQLHARATAA